jgi:hypothetical protein
MRNLLKNFLKSTPSPQPGRQFPDIHVQLRDESSGSLGNQLLTNMTYSLHQNTPEDWSVIPLPAQRWEL